MEGIARIRPLSYVGRLDERATDSVTLLVIHCTELPDLDKARAWGEKILHEGSKTGNSGHFYIDRDGRVEQWVPVERVAHHVRGHNACSVGIELVNRGRYPDWLHSQRQTMSEPYPAAQLDALARLVKALSTSLPCLEHVAGHEDLDREWVAASDDPDKRVRRKVDPGPLFPWRAFMADIPLTRTPPREEASGK